MSTIGLPLLPGTLPFECYPASPQAFYQAMFSLGSAQTNSLTGVIISEATPDPEDQDKAWIKLSGLNPLGMFIWHNTYAQWVWPHASAASGGERRLWVGTTLELSTYDGGDGGAPGLSSGPMWDVDAGFLGRSPMGPGLIPDTADTLVVATNYGEGKHVQTLAEMATHNHEFKYSALSPGSTQVGLPSGPAMGNALPGTNSMNTENSGTSTPANVVHPVRGAYVIKRTNRVFYLG